MKEGVFILQEKSFLCGNRKAVIKSRKEKTVGKPELYLIELDPFKYISSLFPTTDSDTYTFDTDSQVYKLRLDNGQVEISIAE